jgi:hypothetical protein
MLRRLRHTVIIRIVSNIQKEHGSEDERANIIAQKSALISYQIVLPQMQVISLLLRVISFGKDPYSWQRYSADIMLFVSMLLMMVYAISYFAINRGMQKNG